MSGLFLYYLPGKQRGLLQPDDLREAGLETSLRDCLESPRAFQERLLVNQVHARGPDGSSGVIVAAQPGSGREIVQKLGYHAAEQAWLDCGRYWLGRDKLHRPTPVMLARPHLVSGYDEPLGDGNVWTLPVIRRGGLAPNLPRTMGVGSDGGFQMHVLPEFDWAWKLAGEIWDNARSRPSLEWSYAFSLAVGVLSLNYRVGPQEATALDLITTINFQKLFSAAIDWPRVEELLAEQLPDDDPLKKNGSVNENSPPPAPANTSPGSPGG